MPPTNPTPTPPRGEPSAEAMADAERVAELVRMSTGGQCECSLLQIEELPLPCQECLDAREHIARALDAARLAGRVEGMREAAKVAEDVSMFCATMAGKMDLGTAKVMECGVAAGATHAKNAIEREAARLERDGARVAEAGGERGGEA